LTRPSPRIRLFSIPEPSWNIQSPKDEGSAGAGFSLRNRLVAYCSLAQGPRASGAAIAALPKDKRCVNPGYAPAWD
jgi:hypothetical protein